MDRRRSTDGWGTNLWSGLEEISCCFTGMVTDFRKKGTASAVPVCPGKGCEGGGGLLVLGHDH